ncbi:MAG: molybdopterin-dependent oxidoreductase [Acidobacteria bacterium]|nr:molybdopterin-dependent oxidoreductase [Acidobacteriota bacterium]
MKQETLPSTGLAVSTPRNFGRRMALRALGIAGLLASLPSSVRAYFVRSLPVRTVEKETFLFDPASGSLSWKKERRSEPYRLAVGGMAADPVELSYAELLALPRVSQTSDLHCVEGWSVKDIVWEGFRFSEIARITRPLPGARYAVFHSLGETSSAPRGQGHYIECLPVESLVDPARECLLALALNGKPLPHDHGAPLRLVAPLDLAYKSIKYVRRIDFVAEPVSGWWTLANPIYPADAPVPASRLRRK